MWCDVCSLRLCCSWFCCPACTGPRCAVILLRIAPLRGTRRQIARHGHWRKFSIAIWRVQCKCVWQCSMEMMFACKVPGRRSADCRPVRETEFLGSREEPKALRNSSAGRPRQKKLERRTRDYAMLSRRMVSEKMLMIFVSVRRGCFKP